MPDRIDTPTAIADLFGLGKNGFGAGPPATQLSPQWFNGIQESVIRTIEFAGLTPDALNFDQMPLAIANYPLDSPSVTGTLTIESGAFLVAADGSLVNLKDGSGLVAEMGSTIAVESGVNFIWADNTITFGTSNGNAWTINGNVTIGTDAASQHSVNGVFQTGLTGLSTGVVKFGLFEFIFGQVPAIRQLGVDTNNDLLYNDGAGNFVHYSVNGPFVPVDADQVPETILQANNLFCTTAQTASGLLRIKVSGEGQRNTVGDIDLSIEQDQGTGTWIPIDNGGVTTKTVRFKDTSIASDWTVFQIERTFGAGATNTLFRARVQGLGGSTAKVRDAHLKVRRLGTG